MFRNLWYLFRSGRNMNEQLLRLQPMLDIQQLRNAIAPLPMQNRIRTRDQQREDMAEELNFRRRSLAFDEIEVASDEDTSLAVTDSEQIEDSDDDEDVDDLDDSINNLGQLCPKRRGAHTMPGYGVDEHVTQPILWLALEQLRKRENLLKRRLKAVGRDVTNEPVISPADFVANYLIRNMSLEIFNDGNQPRYGPGLVSGGPRRRMLPGLAPT